MNTKNIPGLKLGSPRWAEARVRVPNELKPQFDSLLEDYAWSAFKRYGRACVSYDVIADLILAGWRGPEPGNKA